MTNRKDSRDRLNSRLTYIQRIFQKQVEVRAGNKQTEFKGLFEVRAGGRNTEYSKDRVKS